jgi:hypothetical protein
MIEQVKKENDQPNTTTEDNKWNTDKDSVEDVRFVLFVFVFFEKSKENQLSLYLLISKLFDCLF